MQHSFTGTRTVLSYLTFILFTLLWCASCTISILYCYRDKSTQTGFQCKDLGSRRLYVATLLAKNKGYFTPRSGALHCGMVRRHASVLSHRMRYHMQCIALRRCTVHRSRY